jgi:hypothetical protein
MSALTTAKTVTVKLGHAERRAVRIQRRIWLAQALMWPALLLLGLLGAVALVRVTRARQTEVSVEKPTVE